MKIGTLLFIALLALSGTANAEYPHNMRAGVLRADCELLDRPSQVRCEALLMGVVDTVNAFIFWEKLDEKYFCTPERITDVRLRQIFVDYVAAENVDIIEPAVSVTLRAFGRAFPCE